MGDESSVIRMDKFLWAVRIFKTRTLAAEACDRGRVIVNGTTVKPSRAVKIGDKIMVKKLPVNYSYEVTALLGNRVSASLVSQYLLDLTPQEEIEKNTIARLTAFTLRDPGAGRPTKKERREIDRFMDPE